MHYCSSSIYGDYLYITLKDNNTYIRILKDSENGIYYDVTDKSMYNDDVYNDYKKGNWKKIIGYINKKNLESFTRENILCLIQMCIYNITNIIETMEIPTGMFYQNIVYIKDILQSEHSIKLMDNTYSILCKLENFFKFDKKQRKAYKILMHCCALLTKKEKNINHLTGLCTLMLELKPDFEKYIQELIWRKN